MSKPLTQVEIIQSLGEALSWFKKELQWRVDPASLGHLSGRIGELYAAMITRGQMALAVNQKGYDVVSSENEHVSVKTVTSSNHVTFNKNTLAVVDRVMILRINVDGDEVSIEEVFDGMTEEIIGKCKENGADLTYAIKPRKKLRPLDDLQITDEATVGNRRVVQFENGTIVVEVNGVRQSVTKPVLRDIGKELGISVLNENDNLKNTRQLGAEIIAAVNG